MGTQFPPMGMTWPMGVWLAEAAALELCAEAREAAVASTEKMVYCMLIWVGDVCS